MQVLFSKKVQYGKQVIKVFQKKAQNIYKPSLANLTKLKIHSIMTFLNTNVWENLLNWKIKDKKFNIYICFKIMK